MKIVFIKDTHGLAKGYETEVSDFDGRQLIEQGLAEEVGEKEEKNKRQTKEQK